MPGIRGILNAKTSGRMTDVGKPVASKSKLKRIFERQFPHILRNSTVENPSQAPHNPLPVTPYHREGSVKVQNKNNNDNKTNSTLLLLRTASDNFETSGSENEPSSLCLADMVHDFMENGEKNPDCGRACCKCLNGHFNKDGNEEEEDDRSGIRSWEMCEILKSLVPCASLWERNILADASRLVEAANLENICENKEECTKGCLRRCIGNRLRSYGYNAAVCKSKWDQASGLPAGEYEYIDVIVEGAGMVGKQERLIVDIDFRSQFEIARSTSRYAAVLHSLPLIFVGKPERLHQIVSIVCEAAKQSLKKKGLHIPPWRKAEYMRAKWLSPYERITTTNEVAHSFSSDVNRGKITSIAVKGSGWGSRFTSEFELQFCSNGIFRHPPVKGATGKVGRGGASQGERHVDDQISVVITEWQPPAVKPKTGQRGGKIAAGLASMLRETGLGSKP